MGFTFFIDFFQDFLRSGSCLGSWRSDDASSGEYGSMCVGFCWALAASILLVPMAARSESASPKPSIPAAPAEEANSCMEGTIAGGLIGAGIGGVATRGRARWIGVPIGAVGGALLGCQIDGG